MVLVYKFKKEKLEDGKYVSRPRILVAMHGKDFSIEVPALIDSGCDTTVIPEGMARALCLDMRGEKSKLYAYRESTNVIHSKVRITFIGKQDRQSVTLEVPILIALSKKGFEDEEDITLGVDGVFDTFDITFKKSQNKIVLKRVNKIKRFKF